MKTDLLPIVGSIAGLGALKFGPWFDRYESVRTEAGLASIIRADDARAVLWPKRSTTGELVETIDCTSNDLSIALKNILSKFGWHREDLQNHSSHSMKATLLSFAAKRGSMDEGERRILGYHMERGTGTVKCYARDNMSVPLRKLCTTVREISAGYFLPSSSRSGRFPSDEGDSQIHIDERFAQHLSLAFPSSPKPELALLRNGHDDETVTVSDERSDEDASLPDVEDAISCGDEFGFQTEENQPGMEDTDEFNGVDDAPGTHGKATACGDELGLLTPGSQLDLAVLQATSGRSSDSSSDSSSSSSDAESTVFEDMAAACDFADDEADAVKSGLWKVRGGKFHLSSTKSEVHFKCGSKITQAATRLITKPRFLAPRCQRCFSK